MAFSNGGRRGRSDICKGRICGIRIELFCDYSEFPNSAKALIAYAGIDAPPYQSGQFTGTKRHISKRGDSNLRKLGYELMDSVNKHKSLYGGDPVCEYFIRKRNEGKPYRVAMIAAFNKFLRIYHSKVSAVLNGNDKKK